MAGLLFLAFAYLAVGQAGANRNGAQTAADAAALAAALDTRDQLADAWLAKLSDPTAWQAIFEGDAEGVTSSCGRAYELAEENDATAQCSPEGLLAYKVDVRTNKTVGDSIVPGTENVRSRATATAVIEPSCTFELPAEPPGDAAEDDSADDAGAVVLPKLTCKDTDWTLNPRDLTHLPEPQDLFDVHLTDHA